MEVGGNDYKKLKQELDEVIKAVFDTERTMTRHKTTLEGSESNLKRIDQEIERDKEDISKATRAKEKLQDELNKNDEAGKRLLEDCQACEKVKDECNSKLETKKASFNQMKRDMASIDGDETKLKDRIEELVRDRNMCKDKCDKVKYNIKTSRERFNRSIDEFGKNLALDEDQDQPPLAITQGGERVSVKEQRNSTISQNS